MLFVLAPTPPDTLEWKTLPKALGEAQTEQQPTLVYVHAAWCGPCRQLERETFTDARVLERLAQFSKAELTFDDRDTKHRVGPYRLSEADWAKRLGASSTPTLVVLSPDGGVLGRHTGFLPPDGVLPILDAALTASTD